MSYSPHSNNASTLTIKVVCALAFLLFTFLWLFFFQADVLAVAQHALSNGQTHYNRTIGAVLITIVLFLLQQLVYGLTRLSGRSHALTYFPSMLILAFIGDVSCDVDLHHSYGLWPLMGLLLFLLWAGAVVIAKKTLSFPYDMKEPSALFSRRMWINLLTMTAMMLGVALVNNTNAVFHFTAHAEASLMQDDADDALSVGSRSHETDESLTMLRVFALSKQGLLADCLFEYPVCGTSRDMLPMAGSKSRLRMMPDTLLWDHFGRRPEQFMTTERYLDSLEVDTMATEAWRDYRLTGMLIDRRLDAFVDALPHYYTLNDSLPRYYREALQIYQHEHDTLVYNDTLMQAAWREYARLDSLYPVKTERKTRAADNFRSTYWYYYSE